MLTIRNFLASMCLALLWVSAAAAEVRPELWQSVAEGDTPVEVAEKLDALPEIEKVKIESDRERERLSISYVGDGYTILGTSFRILPEFVDGRLAQISMGSDRLCTAGFPDLYGQYVRALRSKYPTVLFESADEYRLNRAKLSARRGETQQLQMALANEDSTVTFVQLFENDPRRSGSDRLACNREPYRVRLMIIYMSKQRFNAMLEQTKSQDVQTISAAADRL